jgi:ubiquinone/menaquinone biosynthesis C-methylase UbiE
MHTREGWTGWDEYADFYDWENARTVGRRDVNYWRRFVRESKAPVLELGCGTGRVLAPIAREGVRVVGVDRSAPMLARAIARGRRSARSARPCLARSDVRSLPFRSASFGAVIAAYGLLQSLVTDADLEATLAEVARVLVPGGRFGIDLVPDLSTWDEYRRKLRLRGRAGAKRRVALVESVRQDRRRGVTIFDEEFTTSDGRRTSRRRFELTFRTVAVDEIILRLARAGFEPESVAGDYRGGPWGPSSDTWLIVARRRDKRPE